MIDKYVPQSQETFAELYSNKDIFSSLKHFEELVFYNMVIFLVFQKMITQKI